MYTGTSEEAVALDAATGRQFWKVSHPLDPTNYYNAYLVNKGMAVAGNTLFWATVDCHLLAIDVKDGPRNPGRHYDGLEKGLSVQRRAYWW